MQMRTWRVLLALTFCAGADAGRAALDSGWMEADIGAPSQGGTAGYTNGTWTVTGGGTGVANHGDQFHFVFTRLNGDGALIAELAAQAGADSGGHAGVMMRSDAASGAPEASVLVTSNNELVFRYRAATNGDTTQLIAAPILLPAWARLSHSNDFVTATYSTNGVDWLPAGTAQVAMGERALAGMAVAADSASLANTAAFTCVLAVAGPQTGVPADLARSTLAWQTTWPLPHINIASNALTPRMGWNSWFVFGGTPGPSESVIESTADALVDSGLAAAGYRYVVIDCSWIAAGRGSRDTNGNLVVDPVRWPNGMKAVADYVHSKGLLMGGYSDIGSSGWGNPSQIGSYAHYQQDADQFAAWGWDFIKVDDHGPGDFYAMAKAIAHNSLHRPIVLSLSTADTDAIKFAPRIANSFRVAFDISLTFGSVSWDGILDQFDTAREDWYAQAPGHWGDPDMLCTGLNGITDSEGRSHFNLWAILGAPLMIGTEVRTNGTSYAPYLSAATLSTLTNLEVIAVDQDPLGAVGTEVASNIYAKPLGSFTAGRYAVLLLNRSSQPAALTVNWSDLGLIPGHAASVRDLWAHTGLGNFTSSYTTPVLSSHDSILVTIAGDFDWTRPRIYEAESGYNTLAGTAYYVPHNGNFSAAAYVTGVGSGIENTLTFNKVAAPADGLYEATLYYACAEDRTALVSVKGQLSKVVVFPSTGSDTSVGGASIYVRLLAGENRVGICNPSGPAPNLDKLVISAPMASDLRATGGDTQVALDWLGPAGGRFNVYRGTSSGGEGTLPIAAGLTNTHYLDTNVVNGETYYYTATFYDPVLGFAESAPSDEASARPRMATSSSAYRDGILAENPVAYWRLNETNGSVAADSAGGFNGAYGTAVTLGIPGLRPPDYFGFETGNTAVGFENQIDNCWITIPPLHLNSDQATLACWIFPDTNQVGYAGLVFYRSSLDSTAAGLNFTGSGLTLGYTWNNDYATWAWNSGLSPKIGQWSFVALTVSPDQAVLYLGDPGGLQAATNSVHHPAQGFGAPGTIGTDMYSPLARIFSGAVDEVSVFDKTLAAAGIRQLYWDGFRLPQVSLEARFSGSDLSVAWPQGTLFEAESPAGPWSRVAGALSPYHPVLDGTNRFYRVVLQQ